MHQRADTTSSGLDRAAPSSRDSRGGRRLAVLACFAIVACNAAVRLAAQEGDFPGRVLWQIGLAAPPARLPAFDQRRAYIALQDGTIVAIDHAAGQPLWSASVSTSVDPAVAGPSLFGANGAAAWALEADTGRPRWRNDLRAKALLAPVVTDAGPLFLTEGDEAVLLASEDGREIWRQALGARPVSAAASPPGRAWTGLADGRVLALRTSSPGVEWIRQLGSAALVVTPLDDRLLVGSADNFLYALRITDGGVAWRWRTGGDVVARAAADAKRVYFVSMDATLRAVDRRHGDMRWQRPLTTRTLGAPLLAGGILILAGVSPELRAFSARDGGPAGSVPVPGRALDGPFLATARGSSPARLLVLTAGGYLMAIGQPIEPRLVPLEYLPGRALPPEVPPPAR